MYGRKMEIHFWSCMDIQISFIHSLYFRRANLFLRERTGVSRFGTRVNASRQSHYLQYQSGVSPYSQMGMSFAVAVTAKFASLLEKKCDTPRTKISKNSKPKSRVLQSHRNPLVISTKKNSLVSKH